MTDQTNQSFHTDGAVADYFVIEGHIMSTRSADAYKAIDKSRGASVCLWILRHPLALNSNAVLRFLKRLTAIKQISPPVTDMQSFGVDAAGMAFSVFNALDGHVVDGGNIEPAEGERRLTSSLRIIGKLHANGIVCGDLCNASFWVDRSGDVRFVGAMGSFDAEAVATAMVPPLETLHYVAPEQKSGAGLEPATDVFALGVLGYRLLTKRFPLEGPPGAHMGEFDLGKVKPISSFVNVPPVWAEEVIFKCLDPRPENRYQSAEEVLNAISEIRQRVFAEEKTPVQSRRDPILVKKTKENETGVVKSSAAIAPAKAITPEKEEEKVDPVLSMRVKIMGALLIVALCALVAVQQLRRGGPAPGDRKLQQELSVHRSVVGNEQLRQAIDVISEPEVSLPERATELEKIVNSDDPLAHDILVKSAKDAKSAQLRALSEKSIIDRARRLGLLRSAEQVRQWLRTLRQGEMPPSYEAVLQSLDVTLPGEAHNSYLRQAYATNPVMVLRLAAALALDSNKLPDYQPVLAQLIGDSMKFDDAKSHSTLALILSSPELSVVFGDDVIQRREQIPNEDILWLLKILANRGDINVRPVASAAVERGILSPLRGTYLAVIRDRGDLPPDVLNSLIRASAGILRVEDIGPLGRWYDVGSEKILLSILADSSDSAVLTEAFDTLSGKSLTSEPGASLVEWVRNNKWDNRADFAHGIGTLSNSDILPAEDVVASLAPFEKFLRDGRIVNILLETKNTAVIKLLVEKHSDILGLGGLLTLLDYPDKSIRIAAIKELKSYNDMSALRMIIQHYDQEKDPEVQQVYRDSFWAIKERKQGGG
ncbi:MAG: hypothetical protein J0M12_05000 [Deltaproteobacteria bacterium]|nr:hypothetical protein [Deltaproteobacteria bacterium]